MDNAKIKQLKAGGAAVKMTPSPLVALVEEQRAANQKSEERMIKVMEIMVDAIGRLNARSPSVKVEPASVQVTSGSPRVARMKIERDGDGNISALIPVYSNHK